jgi:hypothetical protein
VATEAFALPTTAISAVPPAALPASAAAEPVKDGAAPHGLIAAAKWAATDGVTGANFRMFCAGSVMPSPGAAQRAWDEWCAELKDWSARGAPPLSARSSKLAGGGCEIAETALRGITLKQLRAVYGQACEACRAERWRSYDRASKSWTGAAEIVPDAPTLYELVQYWLKPQTEALECSMFELLADGPQPPRYFVSHWWGEAVKDFIACVDVHVHDHRHIGVDENTPYWVRATAAPPRGIAFAHACPASDPSRVPLSPPTLPSPLPRARRLCKPGLRVHPSFSVTTRASPLQARSARTPTTSTESARSWRAA